MKLAKIYRKYTLMTLALVILLGGIFFYNIIMFFVHQSDNHTLMEFKENLELYINDTGRLPSNSLLNKGRISHQWIDQNLTIEPQFSDTVVYSSFKGENVVYRTLTYTQDTPQGTALITLWQTSMDTEDIISAIIISLLSFFILYAFFSLWWNRWFMRKLWSPFYQILNQLNKIELTDRDFIDIENCNVDEFNSLAKVANRMLFRINDDYMTLQGLTETTSHELQTPLSIIKAKIELIQQDSTFSEKQFEQIKTLETAIDRLARLNRFLLTIARINNNQFVVHEKLILNQYVDEFLDSYSDFIDMKKIRVQKYYENCFELVIHPQLAEILVSNLLSNAIRYNVSDGKLDIIISSNSLRISNTYGNKIPTGNLLARFKKSNELKDSTGLGLSIVDSICKKNNLRINIDITPTEFSIEIIS